MIKPTFFFSEDQQQGRRRQSTDRKQHSKNNAKEDISTRNSQERVRLSPAPASDHEDGDDDEWIESGARDDSFDGDNDAGDKIREHKDEHAKVVQYDEEMSDNRENNADEELFQEEEDHDGENNDISTSNKNLNSDASSHLNSLSRTIMTENDGSEDDKEEEEDGDDIRIERSNDDNDEDFEVTKDVLLASVHKDAGDAGRGDGHPEEDDDPEDKSPERYVNNYSQLIIKFNFSLR